MTPQKARGNEKTTMEGVKSSSRNFKEGGERGKLTRMIHCVRSQQWGGVGHKQKGTGGERQSRSTEKKRMETNSRGGKNTMLLTGPENNQGQPQARITLAPRRKQGGKKKKLIRDRKEERASGIGRS